MTPGTYLRKRREAAGIQPGQISADTGGIESDKRELPAAAILAYEAHVTFDRDVLFDLLYGVPVQLCRVCACSHEDPCEGEDGPCGWAEQDLCTACVGKEPAQ